MRRLSLFLGSIVIVACSHESISEAPPIRSSSNAPSTAAPLNKPAPAYTTLYSFASPPDGNSPTTHVVLFSGRLYGSTYGGGETPRPSPDPCSLGCGTVYWLDANNPTHDTIIHRFKGSPDGAVPAGALNFAQGTSTLYGMTQYGGSKNDRTCPHGCGTVFEIDAANKESVVYSFSGMPDGANPVGGLVALPGTNTFYGTTEFGGRYGLGTVFALVTKPFKYSRLYSFRGKPKDGAYPIASLVRVGNALYGVTRHGGGSDVGTVYRLDVSKSPPEETMHAFTEAEGDYPSGLDAVTTGSVLYGTTSANGPYKRGTVFSITTSRRFRVIYSFKKDPDAGLPLDTPRLLGNSLLYGTTWGGGKYGVGAIYALNTSGTCERVLHSFQKIPDGIRPIAPLREWNGVFYGTTVRGGTNGLGTVFKIPPSNPCQGQRAKSSYRVR